MQKYSSLDSRYYEGMLDHRMVGKVGEPRSSYSKRDYIIGAIACAIAALAGSYASQGIIHLSESQRQAQRALQREENIRKFAIVGRKVFAKLDPDGNGVVTPEEDEQFWKAVEEDNFFSETVDSVFNQ